MKRKLFLAGLAAVALSLIMSGCNSMKKMQKDVLETAVVGQITPVQLESVEGVVNFEYKITFAAKQFDKKMILKITPKMQYGNQMLNLTPMFLQGENVKDATYPVVSYKTPTAYTQKFSMPFRDGMQNGVLWADIEAIKGKKSFMMSPVILNKNGVKQWQSYPVKIDGVSYVPVMTETFVADVPAERVGVVSGYVMFPLGKSTISTAEQNSAVMSQAVKAMDKVLTNKNAKITNMFIYISNSPEGAERLNKSLATNRFKSAKNFFEKDLKLSNTALASNPKFVVQQTVAENWKGLYMLLEDSNIKNKDEIISALKNAPNAARRNALLDSYSNKTPELKETILPILRRADFFVFYTVPEVIQEEGQLTYFVPQLTEKTPAVTAQTNWQLLNDLAVMAIDMKDYKKAQKLLESAITLKQDATVNNNMGIMYVMQGNKSKAAEMFDKAKIRKEARYNMGLILLQEGNYSKAIPYLKEMPNINLAYAQMMNNDNRDALETFKKMKMNNAMDYYMMAVAAARVKNTQEMATSLQKAIQMQPELKKWAATDVAFYPYKGDAVYMQIVK